MRFDHKVSTQAVPRDVWAVWTDVARWPGRDVELGSASIEGDGLALGVRGTLEPKRGPVSRFVVSEFERGKGYAFKIRRRLGAQDGGTTLTHEVSFVGPLSFLFRALLGGRFRAALPGVVCRIAESQDLARPLHPDGENDGRK